MSYINPFAAVLQASPAAQRQLSADKARQSRQSTALTRNIAADDDRLEHQVDSAEFVSSIHDEQSQHDEPGQHQRKRHAEAEDTDAAEPRLDIKA